MRNIDKVLGVIAKNPLGLDDDEISERTGIVPRQQVYQLCSKLAAQGSIERRSVEKQGKRRKIHNFPVSAATVGGGRSWERRLAALEAATGLTRDDILDQALASFARALVASDASRGPVSGN